MDASAVEVRNLSTGWTWRCCRCSLHPLHLSVLLQRSCSWRHMVLKNISSIVAAVVSFVVGAVWRNAEKKGLLVFRVSSKSHVSRKKDPFRSCGKKEPGTDCGSSGSGCTRSRLGPKVVIFLSGPRKKFHSRDKRCGAC